MANKTRNPYCPWCGAGKNPDGTFRLANGYPFNHECPTCKERGEERFRALGRKVAYDREQKILKFILSD